MKNNDPIEIRKYSHSSYTTIGLRATHPMETKKIQQNKIVKASPHEFMYFANVLCSRLSFRPKLNGSHRHSSHHVFDSVGFYAVSGECERSVTR
jgi:hypothetical protein